MIFPPVYISTGGVANRDKQFRLEKSWSIFFDKHGSITRFFITHSL